MNVLYVTVSIIYLLICISLVTIIMAQQKKSSGLGGAMSGMGSSPQTYWDKNKGRSIEGKLHTITKILGTVFIILSLVLTIIW